MGGHPGGDLAARLAIAAVREAGVVNRRKPLSFLWRVFSSAAERIGREARQDPNVRDMGTTLTAVLIDEGRAWVGHIGDTRLYWFRGLDMVQITRDHTMAQDLIQSGLLSPALADKHPTSHILTRCLGTCPDQTPDLSAAPILLEPGDRLLLSTDGLVKAVPPAGLARMVHRQSLDRAVEDMVGAGLQGGAPDNITVILIEALEATRGKTCTRAVPFATASGVRWLHSQP